jgi:dihydroorotate dehydrogenase
MTWTPHSLTYPLARAALFQLDAEHAHDLTMNMLALGQRTPLALAWKQKFIADPVTIAGLNFPNRVGLAAGLDKNARCVDAFAAMGFGFIEVGTVTPLAQSGNAKPRMFRIPKASALINRLGFNNTGLDAFIQNVKRSDIYSKKVNGYAGLGPNFQIKTPLIGLNIGKNAATPIERATDDYLTCLAGVYPHADYITVNISSPNTKNLRSLQSDEALEALLGALDARRKELADEHGCAKPIFLKIAPDLDEAQVDVMAQTLLRYGSTGGKANNAWGLIATNTTLSRAAVTGMPHAEETGGLSGQPVFELSNAVVSAMRAKLGTDFPIIGVGGIASADQALSKIRAGADAVQIYTGFIYEGPALVTRIGKAFTTRKNALKG